MILLQKYNGRNSQNNRIIVDFDNRTVKFKKVGSLNVVDLLLKTNIGMGVISYLWFMAIPIILYGISYGNFEIIKPEVLTSIGYTGIGIIMIPTLTTLNIINKKWREEKLPKHMAYLTKISRVLILNKIKKIRVTPSCLYKKQYIISNFDNIKLEYKLFGDFASNIKNINIINKYNNNPDNWYAIIEFKTKPKSGYMQLEII